MTHDTNLKYIHDPLNICMRDVDSTPMECTPMVYQHGLKLKEIDNFTYLLSIFSKAVYNNEITARSAKANVAFGRL